jgi:hypothetical protein
MASAPNQLHVGTIDISPFLSIKGSQSEGNVHGIAPRKLWGDCVEEVCLPSPPGFPSTEAKKHIETGCPLFEGMKSDKEVRPSIICDSNNFSEYNACLFSSIHDDQHKVDECDDKLMQVREVIKECDRAQYSSTMHFSSLDSTVPLSKKEDVSSFSLHEFVSVNHLSQHKVDAVDFVQGSIYHNEVNVTPCSPVTPKQASGSAKGFSLDAHCFPPTFVQPVSATTGFMSGSCATDAALQKRRCCSTNPNLREIAHKRSKREQRKR